MCKVFILNLVSDISQADYSRLLTCVSDEKSAIINSYIYFCDAQRSLLADIMVRHFICSEFGLINSELNFSVSKGGKPLLLAPVHIHFNISHSGNWIVCVVDNNEVGIDVETVSPVDIEIAKRFFSENEYNILREVSSELKDAFFYTMWTIKESYLKALGWGIDKLSKSVYFTIENGMVVVERSDELKFEFSLSFLGESGICATCSRYINNISYKQISTSDLLSSPYFFID